MMYAPLNNGIRFFRVNASLESIETDFDRERYGLQYIHKYVNPAFAQPIDFTDNSRIQVITPVNAPVTVQIYNGFNVLIFTDSMAYVGDALNDAALRVYNYTINWSSVGNLTDCSYVVLTQGGTRLRSEPLVRANPQEVLKFVYSNLYDHRDIGSYRNCFEMIAYVPGRLVNPEQPRELAHHTDSRMVDVYLSESHFSTKTLQVYAAPHYLHLIVQYALRHDKLTIFQRGYDKTYESRWQWLEKYESKHIANSSIYSAETVLKKVSDRVRAITGAGDKTYLPEVTVLPVTNVTATSFTANWTGGADSYDVQLSTSPDFSTTIVSINTTANSFTFTGLTACTKYYYRVRAVSCAEAGAWSTGTTTEHVSLHFRAEQNFAVWEADEIVSNLSFFNLFGNLQTVQFKYAPTWGVINWAAYPYRTLAQVEQDIALNAVTQYSIYVQVAGYAQGSEGIGILQYVVPFVRLSVGCLTYNFRGITQDHYIGFRRKTVWQSVTLSGGTGTLSYAFIPDLNALRQEVTYGINSLAALNLAISSHAGTEYAVAIYYTGNATSVTATINLQYT